MAISNEKKSKLNDLMKSINKKTKANISFVNDIEEDLKIKYYKTPSYRLNAMLGGGIVKGKIVELFGESSSGKTSLAIETIAKNQHDDPNFTAGWFETEGSIDPEYLKTLGLDMERLVYWDQKDVGAEKGFDILISCVNSGEFDMIVVNSIGGLLPKKEIEDNIEQANVALTARMLSKLFRIVTGSADKFGTTLLFINQLRANIGGEKWNPMSTTGGKALAFFASQRISMNRVAFKEQDPITKEEGIKVRCRTAKNRYCQGNPYKCCDYYAVFGQGIDYISELPEILVQADILVKSGSWYYYKSKLDVQTIDGIECKWISRTALVNSLKSSKVLLETFENLMNDTVIVSEELSKEEINEINGCEEQSEFDEFDFND